jgi:hypothetical protein
VFGCYVSLLANYMFYFLNQYLWGYLSSVLICLYTFVSCPLLIIFFCAYFGCCFNTFWLRLSMRHWVLKKQASLLFYFLVLQVIRMTKYDYRLSNKLDFDLQKLRCRVNYHALRFTNPIQELGNKLIQRMREKSRYFIALHLRCTLFTKLADAVLYLHFHLFDVDLFEITQLRLASTWTITIMITLGLTFHKIWLMPVFLV